jgi:antitoxin ParD1/3/4
MNVSIGERWEEFVARAVEEGRYGSASEVVRAGLRLVEEREAKLRALRQTLDDAIARGGAHTYDDVEAMIDDLAAQSRDKAQ